MQPADEPVGHAAQEPRQFTTVGRIQDKLAHADVPREIVGFHDPREVVERLDGGMVERVFLGWVDAGVRQAGEGGEQAPFAAGLVLPREYKANSRVGMTRAKLGTSRFNPAINDSPPPRGRVQLFRCWSGDQLTVIRVSV